MKRILLLLLIFPVCIFAQQRDVFRIDSLPKEGVLINQGWKWHAGDNPEWAKPEFDDAGWESIPLDKVVDSLPQHLRPSGIRWFRLQLQFDKNLNKDILALAVEQYGAAEIYMNGKLVQKYGVVSSNPDQVKAYNPLLDPIPFAVAKDGIVVLAVRYTSQHNIHQILAGIPNLLGPKVTLNALEAIQSSKALNLTRHYNSNAFRIGAFFILFITYLALYLYSPFQRANLFFCLFSLSVLIADLIQLKLYDQHWITDSSSYLYLLFHLLLIVGKILLLTAVYYLMNQKFNWWYWLPSGLILLSILFGSILFGFFIDVFIVYHPMLLLLIIHIFPNFINLEIIRITLKSIQSKRKGVWIIAMGGLVFLIASVIFVLSIYFSFIDTPLLGSVQTLGDLLYNISWLSIPLAVSIYFGLDIALTNRSLKEKLIEVRQLSLEKQQILTDQNETLERQVAERTAELSQKNRELEIEAALERIRTRAMAMQHSDELSEAANLLSKEVRRLGIPIWSCGYNIMEKDGKSCVGWMSTEGALQPSFRIPLKVSPTFIKFCESRQNGEELFEEQIGGADLETHYNYMLTLDGFAEILKGFINSGHKLPTFQVNTVVNFAQGNLIFISAEPVPEAHDIFKRFANVFEQTFTRFLDLQKAEAQAEQAKLNLIQIQTEKKRAEDALIALKQTQAQLIQSEKLASLGELTAGIAHEIQNPLNFVNNFAEVSAEMLGEMKEELQAGNTTEAIEIADDLEQNLSKINHHGQRASAIVKGMLEHSRASTGVKEPTDINALADEYLRLAYHGLRAKDNSFNANMETHFDESLPKVEVIPQDIGRVLLNLINNAFYAVNDRAKQGISDYSPTVMVSTRWLSAVEAENAIEISVKDNGNGIPDGIHDKIFQPFFTTKPTGQGTGLGLSLAYDIVTKGHGGSLDINSRIGEGTEFIIRLGYEHV
ncbi:MAG TPA: ATP-binding protein [Haliscomenobacter sp.]|uniref:ATP-binding protein n=1 Tax=Haliscomenobacter sp. TaxID=2717303 RepID=UPI002C899D7F|nr:ATP-binding protein [Haliscomenobacter sp.]HOY17056.1 ATP-binding protein [Haliscomenobacter sp.]